ncbi:CAP domain-containing protein [Patescibacteria group bacterium]|nr:CAP domain-containing protein [Patescibacteria group bacterium]MBU1472686.1 CAP domain-containing protein [Patescibacteria group bacterium]MBU2460131.1 CAP domain-containing protein [Patescibacteria group bacterium]MBU2544388.1 CAP domain-containing protein [Patescibacteria group bacterium]
MARKKHRSSFRVLVAISASIGLLMGIFLTYPNNIPKQLPVPKLAQVYLPPIMWMPLSTEWVLGAQAIDPLDLIASVNKERTSRGIAALRVNPLLMKAAQKRADVILRHQNFSHQDPYEGIILTTVVPMVGYHFAYASENIGMGGVSGPNFVYGFMHSTAHRENLLNPQLVDTGVAIVSGPYKQYYVNIAVQLFAVPGQKKETLGYGPEEIEQYKQALSDVKSQLSPLRWITGKLLHNSFYTDTQRQKLLRQREIITAVYQRIEKSEPLTSHDTLLIEEYNKLTQSTPTTPPQT